jgi:tripeptide aminopeptidase
MQNQLLDRFLRYVKIDTQSAYGNPKLPSTEKQFTLARLLRDELIAIGLQDVQLNDECYITATLPANVSHTCPTIGFVAHIDTAPDFTAEKVEPKIWENYQGQNLVLCAEHNIQLRPDEFPELLQYIGQTLISTNGHSLLGADDKAGVAEIVTAMDFLIKNPQIPHGKIRICFTPDEEIGRGADGFDVAAFGADWAYTMDGSRLGELQYENFNAASAVVNIQGKNVHPGFAKNKMVNSIHIAQDFMAALPAAERPEFTEGYEGFFHLNEIDGNVDATRLHYIIRDHSREKFEARKQFFHDTVARFNQKYDNRLSSKVEDSYYNMREKIEPLMHIVELAEKAMKAIGIVPIIEAIRGGTDGSRLSFMGLPCPNIFAGGMNFHGRYEYVSLQAMQAASDTIVKIVELAADAK